MQGCQAGIGGWHTKERTKSLWNKKKKKEKQVEMNALRINLLARSMFAGKFTWT